MTQHPEQPITELLRAARGGGRADLDRLLEAVYDELRQLAHARMARERPDLTLQATALVHEAYLRLARECDVDWQGRAQFFSAAAEAMRRILIERARRVGRHKHGGGRKRLPLDAIEPPEPARSVDLVALDEALSRFEELDPRRAEVVKLRYFVGLSVAETAKSLQVSERTVNSDWNLARAWLRRELGRDSALDPAPGGETP